MTMSFKKNAGYPRLATWIGGRSRRLGGSLVLANFTKNNMLIGGLEHEWIIFPYIGNHYPNWLSYYSEGLKPPSSMLWIRTTSIISTPRNPGHGFCRFVGHHNPILTLKAPILWSYVEIHEKTGLLQDAPPQWCERWFINPMNTIAIISTINHGIQPLISQLNALEQGPHPFRSLHQPPLGKAGRIAGKCRKTMENVHSCWEKCGFQPYMVVFANAAIVLRQW